MNSNIASFFSSFLQTTHSDAEENDAEENKKVEENAPADEQTSAEEPAAEEEEEEEPEDPQPILREECKKTPKCAPLTKHFEECQEKVLAGHGYKGEDCVEELLMHCADECAAPKLFSKLR